jgi:hypothetical protein
MHIPLGIAVAIAILFLMCKEERDRFKRQLERKPDLPFKDPD